MSSTKGHHNPHAENTATHRSTKAFAQEPSSTNETDHLLKGKVALGVRGGDLRKAGILPGTAILGGLVGGAGMLAQAAVKKQHKETEGLKRFREKLAADPELKHVAEMSTKDLKQVLEAMGEHITEEITLLSGAHPGKLYEKVFFESKEQVAKLSTVFENKDKLRQQREDLERAIGDVLEGIKKLSDYSGEPMPSIDCRVEADKSYKEPAVCDEEEITLSAKMVHINKTQYKWEFYIETSPEVSAHEALKGHPVDPVHAVSRRTNITLSVLTYVELMQLARGVVGYYQRFLMSLMQRISSPRDMASFIRSLLSAEGTHKDLLVSLVGCLHKEYAEILAIDDQMGSLCASMFAKAAVTSRYPELGVKSSATHAPQEVTNEAVEETATDSPQEEKPCEPSSQVSAAPESDTSKADTPKDAAPPEIKKAPLPPYWGKLHP